MSLQEGLVGHWTMDSVNTDNGNIRDKSPYAHHGNINGPTIGEESVIGESYSFDGNDGIFVSDTAELRSPIDTNRLTLAAWVYPKLNSTDDRGTIITRNRIYYLQVRNSGNVATYTYNNSGSSSYTQTDETLSSKEWYHIAFTEKNGLRRMYINGSISTEIQQDSSIGSTGSDNLGIGEQSGGGRNFAGRISDARVYNRALSEKEINKLYQMRSRKTQGQASRFPMTLNGKDVVVKRNQYGAWVLVLNYEHYGGENPTVSPGSQFPQLPNGVSTASTVNDIGTSGETRHVDGIDEYGSWNVDAVELEATTDNHNRKIHYFTENQTVIDSVVPDSTKVSGTDITSEVTKYDDHTANLPDSGNSDTGENSDDHIFGPDFPMYKGGTHHWALAGFDNRWEVDDYPGNESNTTVHRVWVRTNKL